MIGQTSPTDPVDQFLQPGKDLERRVADLERALGRASSVPWISPPGLNGWNNYGAPWQTCQYRKVGDIVQIRGLVAGGTIGLAVFNLPAGFRPPGQLLWATDTNPNAHGRLEVETGGNVIARTGSNTYFSINCQFSTTA